MFPQDKEDRKHFIEKRGNLEEKEKIEDDIKYGDIFYLKHYLTQGSKVIFSGDGIASKKLEFLPHNNSGNEK